MSLVATRIRSGARCEEVDSATLGGAVRQRAAMPASANTPPDFAIPALDVRALARRAAVPALLAAVATAAIVIAGGPLQAFADAIGRALDADPRWVAAGAAFELASFAGYVSLLWLVGSRATPRLGFRASGYVTLGGAAATRLLPTGGVGGAALTIWSFRRAGLGARGATRTLLTFLVLLYAVFLGAIAISGGAIALGFVHVEGPFALSAAPAAAAALAIAGGIALGARSRTLAPDAPATASAPSSRLARIRAAVRDTPAAPGTGRRHARRAGHRSARRDRARALRGHPPARRVRLVGLRRGRPVGDAPRARRAA